MKKYSYAKTISLSMLYDHKCFLNSSRYGRRQLLHNKKRLICYFTRRRTQYYLKHDHELNGYYQDILFQYDIRGGFFRLTRVCQSYLSNTDDEFHRLARVFWSIRLP